MGGNNLGITPGLVRGRVEQFEQKIGKGPAQAKQSPAMRDPGAQFEGLSSFKGPDGSASAGAPRRSGLLPGQSKNTAAHALGTGLQIASNFMPPVAAMGATAVGNTLTSTRPNAGDQAVSDYAADSANSLKQQAAMARIASEAKLAAMAIDQQSEAIKGLAKLGTDGAKEARETVTGQ